MHRHGYKGRKFGRETDQRRALIKGLASELIDHETIVTTMPKAKELVPYVEKLITKAKKGDLHNRRQIIAQLAEINSAHKLVDEIAPKLTARNSGHLRIERAGWRRGDNAEMARVSFVDELQKASETKSASTTTAEKKAEEKPKEAAKTEKKAAKTTAKTAPKPAAPKTVAKRTGVRGNR